jgi:photosystem II stability/assembly factor-like uncharacterized protein
MAGPCDWLTQGIINLAQHEADVRQQIAQEQADGVNPAPLFTELTSLEQQKVALQAALRACLQGARAPRPPPSFVKPRWDEEGPGPTAINEPGYTKAAGAVQVLACDPVGADRVFVGAVGGGIWMARDAANASSPTWTPQTDFQSSLCISALAMSPLDPARNTLYAGFGITSHSLVPAGPLLGILKTTDGGATWNELARNVFAGNRVTRLLATGLATTAGEIVLAATLSGLFWTTDGGQDWNAVDRFAGIALCDVASEPGHPRRVYVASETGIFRIDDVARSDDAAQWADITPPQFASQNTSWIRLTVCPMPDAAGNNWVHAGAQAGLDAFEIVSSSSLGAQWSASGQPPNGARIGALLIASPLLPTVFFCADDPTASHWMVDASTGQFTLVDRAGGNATATHTDGRDMQFSADPDILFEVNDGGIYRLINPHGRPQGPPRHWEPAVGNLRITEFYSIAYDSVNHVIFGGAQDQAIPHQTTPGDIDWQINEGPSKDGTRVGVDNTSVPGASVHYFCTQKLQDFTRETFMSSTMQSASSPASLFVNGSGGLNIFQFEGIRKQGFAWVPLWRINRADPSRLVVATDALYESPDSGDHLDVLGGVTSGPDGPVPSSIAGTVTALAYGHNGNPDALYAGAAGKLLVRQSGKGSPVVATAYPGSSPMAIALFPGDWRQAYVLDDQRRVWRTGDAGDSAWAELTGNLLSLSDELNAIEVYAPNSPAGSEVIFAGGLGGVFATQQPGAGRFTFWQKYGRNFPSALVTDMHYDGTDDILVAGTLGRSAWSIRNVSLTLDKAPALRIIAKGPSSCLGGWAENTTFTFSAIIQGESFLVQPLDFRWDVHGASAASPGGPTLSVVMPTAGQEAAVTLTITDAEGYQVFGFIADYTITAAEAAFRDELCQLLRQIQTTAQVNWPIDPLGPPVSLGDAAGFKHSMRALRALTAETVKVLGHLMGEGD